MFAWISLGFSLSDKFEDSGCAPPSVSTVLDDARSSLMKGTCSVIVRCF